MRSIQQSAAYTLMLFMTDSADHITGKAGLTLTLTASKAGGAFAGIAPTVTERGDGWYAAALTTAHTDTLGDLAIRATAAGADPTDLVCQVQILAAALVSDLTAIKAKTDNLPSDPADQSLLTASIAAIPAAPSAAANASAVRAELATELARVDVATSTRLATAGYTAPANADVAAIKAKTDNLPSDPADQSAVEAAIAAIPAAPAAATVATAVRAELATELARVDVATSTRLATAGYTAPANADVAAIKAKTDNLPSDPADQSAVEAAVTGGTAFVLAAIAALPEGATVAEIEASAVLAKEATGQAIKAKTDGLAFTVAGQVDANVRGMNGAGVIGTGTVGDAWRGVGVAP